MEKEYKIVLTGQETRETIKKGVDWVADTIGLTLGPAGRNGLVERRGFGEPKRSPGVTNDGVSIARRMIHKDEAIDTAAQVMIDGCVKTNDMVGDGTTTTAVLAQAIFETGYQILQKENDLIEKTVSPMDLKRQIDESCALAVREIEKLTNKIRTKKDLFNVAFMALEERILAEKVADIAEQVGVDGYISVEEGWGWETKTRTVQGMKLPAHFLTEIAFYLGLNAKQEAIIKDPYIFLTNKEIETQDDLKPLCDWLLQKNIRELVIMSPKFSLPVYGYIVANRIKGIFSMLPIRIAALTTAEIDDVALYTGATFFDQTKGFKWGSTVTMDDLGRADKLVATRDEVIIIGGKGKKQEIERKIMGMKVEKDEATNIPEFKEKMKRRIASLSKGIGLIEVACKTDAEKEYVLQKAKDAVASVQEAQRHGIVEGAGLCLKKVAKLLPKSILTEALEAPYELIRKNGFRGVVGKNVVDPSRVVITALQNACSVAGQLLSSEILVVWHRGGFEEALAEKMKAVWSEQPNKSEIFKR